MVNYKKLVSIWLCAFIVLSQFVFMQNAFSSAAEKWEYDVVPDRNQTLKVTGHKVGYAPAANDYNYKVKIDPKTASNKTKMGTVGINRLLKRTGWGLLGVSAMEALLNAVGWVIDPETQSIWRNKKNDNPSYGGCFDDKYLFQAQSGPKSTCPDKAIEDFWKTASSSTLTYKFLSYQVTPNDVILSVKPAPITYTVTGANKDGKVQEYPNQTLNYSPNPNYVPEDGPKEILTPDTFSDYVNQTHPDFADPTLAPKLAPHVNPQIAPDLWSPANPYEYDNSPTVQEVKTQLDNANPDSPDSDIVTDPDTGNSVLPSFCSWAKVVCDFVKDDKTDKDNNLDIPTPTNPNINTDINFNSSCPAPITLANFSYHGSSQNWQVDFSQLCDSFSTFVKPVVIAMGAFSAVLIVSGVRTNE